MCENNGYAIGTHIDRSTAVTDQYKRVAAYNMKASQHDGMDIDIVRERKVSGVRARQAEKKAERLVQLTRGNAALENSFLTEKEATQFRRGAAQRLLRGSNYALWA